MVAKKAAELKKLMEEKEIDKKVEAIFGEVSDEAKELYLKAKELLIQKLAELKEAVEHIDKEKYMEAVEDTMKTVEKEFKKDSKKLAKLKNELVGEWEKLRG